MIISPGLFEEDGAWIVVSQYEGAASAWADAYDGGASLDVSSGTRYVSSPGSDR